MGLGKLDNLEPNELECYEAWGEGMADHTGGDCDLQGYAWAAFDEDRVIITEDSAGFVSASTYDADDGTGETAYRKRLAALEERDTEFYAERDREEYERKAFVRGVESLFEKIQTLGKENRREFLDASDKICTMLQLAYRTSNILSIGSRLYDESEG